MFGSAARRRLAIVATSILVTAGLSTSVATPAYASAVGYVRLAHLSPDTPAVDVYLTSQSGSVKEQVFRGVGYGVMSEYLALPVGGYTVAMRASGAPKSQKPVLTTQVSVAARAAYTVAGVGRYAELGLRVLNDDLALPAGNKAKVRIIQASVREPILGVSLADGSSVAENVAFATTTDYQLVAPGKWKLVIRPTGGSSGTDVTASLGAGSVYSLLVLDNKAGGLRAELRVDATRKGGIPAGGVATGAGGATSPLPLLAAAVVAVALLAGGVLMGARRRRSVR